MIDLDRVTKLVIERAPRLALYARQWLDAASADDVVQDALAALLIQRTMPDDTVAWMYRTVRNAAIDHARVSSRRRKREAAVAQARREWFEARPDNLIDAQTAEQVLKNLPGDAREVVVMRIWGELGFAQIAEILQISVSTVHTRYTAALAQMRNELEKPPCHNERRTKTT
jgi:RNA polymerase sigma-70 factor (ECF subfamily)